MSQILILGGRHRIKIMKLIIGLGNPGEKYEHTRHNLGFVVVDELVKKLEDRIWKLDKKLKAEIIKTPDIVFAKPQTFMNHSGEAVKLLAAYYKVLATDIVIIHDELDLPLGRIKVRTGGSGAGHHGVESIIEALGDDKFTRVRLGIGTLKTQIAEHKHQMNMDSFVTSEFASDEKPKVKHMLKQAIDNLEADVINSCP